MKNRVYPSLSKEKITEKIQNIRHISIDDFGWLSNFDITISDHDSFELIYKSNITIIKEKLVKYVNDLSNNEFFQLSSKISSYFNDISTISKLVSQRQLNTPSLLRLFLNIPKLQDQLIQSIGGFFSSTCFNDNAKQIRSIAFDIVRDLSYLPYIQNPEQLTNMLFDSILNCHQDIKENLLSCLFLLIDDNDGTIERLFRIMMENDSLVCAILTSIENFSLSPESKDKIRDYVLKNILPSVSTKTLPTVIKFLIATTDDANASITVNFFRENLVFITTYYKEDTLSYSDTDFFIIIELKNSLQTNSSFCKSFIMTLEKTETEFTILDSWILYCLYSIYPLKMKAQQMITALSGKTFVTSSIINSVIGHISGLQCLLYSLIEMMNWMLIHKNEAVSRNGIALASVLFEETKNVGTLQDIVGALLIQVEIGDDKITGIVLSIIDHLSNEQPNKLKDFTPLLQSFLLNFDSLTIELYSLVCTIILKLILQTNHDITHNPQYGQLLITFKKMIISIHSTLRERGVIGYACLINRLNDIFKEDISYLIEQFQLILSYIDDEPLSVLTFYKYLYENKNRSRQFNSFLVQHLEAQLFKLFTGKRPEFGIFNLSNRIIEFRLSKNKSKTLSLAYSSYALSLLLESSDTIKEEIFGCSFSIADSPIDLRITTFLCIQSYLMQLLNAFTENIDRNYVLVRMEQLIEIEDQLIEHLSNVKTYANPFYGPLFKNHRNVLKKLSNSSLFIEKYRRSFPLPLPKFFSILFLITIPLNDLHLRIVLRIVIDYLFILSNNLLNCESLSIVKYLSNQILNAVLKDDREISQLIIETIFKIICIESSLNQNQLKQLFMKCCGSENKLDCFKKFAKIMIKYDLNEESKVALIILLKTILHADNDLFESNEYKILCKFSKSLLKSNNPILSKSGVQNILPIFFDHKRNVLKEITAIITVAFVDVIIHSKESLDYPSLTMLTFPLYFNSCFIHLNRKLIEAKKKIESISIVLTKRYVSAALNRLIKLSLLVKTLTLIVCDSHVTSYVYRITLKRGLVYLNLSTELLSFVCKARELNSTDADDLINTNIQICSCLQDIVEYVKSNEPSLQNLVPALCKSIVSWNYSLNSYINEFQ